MRLNHHRASSGGLSKSVGLMFAALLLTVTASQALGAEVEIAELPRQKVTIDIASNGKLIKLDADGDFQAALERAEPGDTIELLAGAVYQGNFTLPRKAGTQWISIRSSQSANTLPARGTRVTHDNLDAMATLSSDSGPVLITAVGAHHYRFTGIEFRPSTVEELGANTQAGIKPVFLNTLIWLGVPKAIGEDLPHHFIFERCYLQGDPVVGGRRGMILNAGETAIVDSHLSGFKMEREDSQAIIGWDGTGPYLIANNFLEGAGENIMFGGADPSVKDRVPADIEIRGNHFSKPLSWMEGSVGFQGTTWQVKNLFELKNARRVSIQGNLFEYNWPQAQNGFAILFTVRNQEGTAPWSVVEDINFSHNIVRHVANGINILGRDDNHTSQATRRIEIRNNLFEDIGGMWNGGIALQLLDGVSHLHLENNTLLSSDRIINNDGRASQWVVLSNNIMLHNRYGIIGSGTGIGNSTLTRYFKSVDMQGNLIVGGTQNNYPSENFFPENIDAVGFTDVNASDFRLSQRSPYRDHTNNTVSGVNFTQLCAAMSITEKPELCKTTQP